MEQLPALSIIIPSNRRADLLRDCLESVIRHAPEQTEIIVVDDGSQNAIISKTAASFSHVRVIRLPRPGGFCVAANQGIRSARHEIVELLNDDTVVTEGWSQAALVHFQNAAVGAVAPLVFRLEPERLRQGFQPRIDSAGDEYDFGGFARKRGSLQFLSAAYQVPQSVWGVSATAGFYRRSAMLAAGGFPEAFQAYFEDVDLSFRLRRLNYEIYYEPASVVWHHVSASYGKRPSRRVLELQSRNEEWVFWRNLERPWKQLPRHLLVLLAKAARRLQEGTLGPWLTGRVRFLAEHPTN